MIVKAPISLSEQVKKSEYEIRYPHISGAITIKYDHKTKRFTEFEVELSDLKLENLKDVIARLQAIQDELDPQFKFEDFKYKPKWWKFW